MYVWRCGLVNYLEALGLPSGPADDARVLCCASTCYSSTLVEIPEGRRQTSLIYSTSQPTPPHSNSQKWYEAESLICAGHANNSNRLHRTPPVSRRCSMYVQPKLSPDCPSDHMLRSDSCAHERDPSCEDTAFGSPWDKHKKMAGIRG